MNLNKKPVSTIKNFPIRSALIVCISIMVSGLLSGCIAMKQAGVKSPGKLYETFFVGNEGTQYFINPLAFKSNGKGRMDLDMVFRYKNIINDSAIVNISFFHKEIFRNADSVKIINHSGAVIIKKMQLLFSERSNKEYKSRFTMKGSLAAIYQLFKDADWHVYFYRHNEVITYIPTAATKNKINKLKFEIFTLMKTP